MAKLKSILLIVAILNPASCRRYGDDGKEDDHGLHISRPKTADPGDRDVEFVCTLSDDYHEYGLKVCHIETPDKRSLRVDYISGKVTEDGREAREFTAIIDDRDGRTCGLRIRKFSEADLGRWSCTFNSDMQTLYTGSFHFVTREDGYLKEDLRLPYTVRATRYEVTMTPLLLGASESIPTPVPGSVKMNFVYDGPDDAKKIFLHSKGIDIFFESVRVTDGTRMLQIRRHELSLDQDFYIVHLEEEMRTGDSYSIFVEFESKLQDKKLVGFYRTKYKDKDSVVDKFIAATQFQAVEARTAFPCHDEPDRKAVFSVRLGRPLAMSSRSNMEVIMGEKMDERPGYYLDVYGETPEMPVYLLAFMVSDFEELRADVNHQHRTKVNAVFRPGLKKDAHLLADYSSRLMEFFEEYFGIKYPLPKLDAVIHPDFLFNGMENWGITKYKESKVIYKEGQSSEADREYLIYITAHENAHQWFGDLVTMKWWDDLWLNEGFATYMATIGADDLDPSLKKKSSVLINSVQPAFRIDSLKSSIAVRQDAQNAFYDIGPTAIIYWKGEAILRMLSNVIGDSSFIEGVRSYLREFAFGNARTADLWRHMEEQAAESGGFDGQVNLTEFMDGFVTQPGFPVVTVQDEGQPSHKISLRQQRFYLDPSLMRKETRRGPRWLIPISVAYPGGDFDTENATRPLHWMEPGNRKRQDTIKIVSRPYILNVNQTGYYRVNYGVENWDELTDILVKRDRFFDIGELNRAQMLDDAFSLARAGLVPYRVPLKMVRLLAHEPDFVPFKAGVSAISYLDKMLRRKDKRVYANFKCYMKSLLKDRFDQQGFLVNPKRDGSLDIKAKNSVNAVMGAYGHRDAVRAAEKQFSRWESNPRRNPIYPDSRTTVYKIVMENARVPDDGKFDFLWQRLTSGEENSKDVSRILDGLGTCQDPEKLLFLLDESVAEDSAIRKAWKRSLYGAIGRTVVGRKTMFNWLVDNFADRIGGANFNVMMVKGFASDANSDREIGDLEDFLEERRDDIKGVFQGVRTLEQGIDQAKANREWMDQSYDEVGDFLEDHGCDNDEEYNDDRGSGGDGYGDRDGRPKSRKPSKNRRRQECKDDDDEDSEEDD